MFWFFYSEDPAISLPYKGDTFSTKILVVISSVTVLVLVSGQFYSFMMWRLQCFCFTGFYQRVLQGLLIKYSRRGKADFQEHRKNIPPVSIRSGKRKFYWDSDLLPSLRFWLSFTWNVCLNLVIKTLSAVPRPHFISTCRPDWNLINCSQYQG